MKTIVLLFALSLLFFSQNLSAASLCARFILKNEQNNSLSEADWQNIEAISVENSPQAAVFSSEQMEGARKYFTSFWIGPYRAYHPEWVFVARDPDGNVVGYLTGCPDTAVFEDLKQKHFYPQLQLDAKSGFFGPDEKNALLLQHRNNLMAAMDFGGSTRTYSDEILQKVYSLYPAHLHINLRPEYQKQGVGTQLISSYIQKLKEKGIKGVHLRCSETALDFYLKMGFKVYASKSRGVGSDGKEHTSYLLVRDI